MRDLEIRVLTCKHGNHTEDDLFDALNGTPAFGSLFIHGRIVSRGVEDRDADIAVGIDYRGKNQYISAFIDEAYAFTIWMEQGRIEFHFER